MGQDHPDQGDLEKWTERGHLGLWIHRRASAEQKQ